MPDTPMPMPAPNQPDPVPTDTAAAPNPASAASAAVPTTGSTQGQPSSPPKETFKQGFMRGAGGENYVVDAQGNVTNARTTQSSGKGTFGSILAGAVMGALAGAHSARPGGIPSAELGGGAGQGAAGATDFFQKRDALRREQAQQNFQNRQSVQTMSREQAESAARINTLAAQNAQLIQETKFETENHPFDLKMKAAELDEHVLGVQKTRQEIQDNQLKLIQGLAEQGVDPSAVLTSWQGAQGYIKDITAGKTLPLYNGKDGGEDHGAALFDVSRLNQPLTKDVTVKTYTADPKTGSPVEKVSTIKAGSESMLNYIGTVMKGQADLQRIMSQQKVAAGIEESKAKAAESYGAATRSEAEAKALGGETTQGQAAMLVEGNMDPSQMSKRANTYNAILEAANQYSLQKYGKPFDIAKASSDYKFATNVQTQNTLKYLNSLTGPDGKSGNLAELQRLSSSIKRTQFPPINDIEAWARLNTGDPAMAAYNAVLTEVADQVGKILQGGTSGGGTSDAKLKQANDLFAKKFTKQQIDAIVGELQPLLSNRKSGLIGDNTYLLRQYNVEPSAKAPGPPAAAPPRSGGVAVRDTSGNILGYSYDGKTMEPVGAH